MEFMSNLESEVKSEKSLTENCAVAYKSAGDSLLDFNFKVTSLRSSSEEDIIKEFSKVLYNNDINTALKYLFYVGDIREGLGERKIFRTCFSYLCNTKKDYAKKLIKLIPEYSRWDILVGLITEKAVKSEVKQIVYNQLIEDESNRRLNKPVSLLAKWMPSENTSSSNAKKLARIYIKELNMTPRRYRKMLSGLRSYIDVVEVKMSGKEWDKINYESVPSVANLRYSEAFLRNDRERRLDYLNALKSGNSKINAKVLQPHQIIRKYLSDSYTYWSSRVEDYNETYEQLWKSLPDKVVGQTLVVRDGSGSMFREVQGGRAIDVATALAIYCSEHVSDAFKNKFITFSESPKFVNLSYCHSLMDKINLTFAEDEIANTNIFKTMKLVLDTAIKNNLSQEDLPDNILIISDMQFDGTVFSLDKTLFEQISELFEKYGYKLPRICFWNLCSYDAKTIPLQKNDYGVILCSGFSINNLNMFMSGEIDPLKILLEVINSDRYKVIDKILK